MTKRKTQEVFSKSKRRVPIDKLLAYWIDLSKRRTITQEDFRLFLCMAEATYQHFAEYYHDSYLIIERDKFLGRVYGLVFLQEQILKKVSQSQQLADREYALMKDVSKKFIPRIQKSFGQQLVLSHLEKTPLQDAEYLISSFTKLTYRWAAGIIASNHIAVLLIRLSKFKKGEKFKDDINTLYANLKNATKNSKLRRFLVRSYRRFEDADKTRNRCAHVNEGEPTRQEIEQSISLGRLLQRFV